MESYVRLYDGLGNHCGGCGEVGNLRRYPMAMLPFCVTTWAPYFGHWLKIEGKLIHQAAQDFSRDLVSSAADIKGVSVSFFFRWPGYGDNMRVVNWLVDRCPRPVGLHETPLGWKCLREDSL